MFTNFRDIQMDPQMKKMDGQCHNIMPAALNGGRDIKTNHVKSERR